MRAQTTQSTQLYMTSVCANSACASAVVFWLGFWFWLGYLGAVLSRFFVSLAVVGTWGDQPPSGVVGGGPARGPRGGATGGAALTFAPGRSAGAVFFQGGSLRDKWLDRAGAVCPSWARKI